jgi:hypothetical protein
MSSMTKSATYGRPRSLASEPAVYNNSDFQVNGDGDIMILGEEEPVLPAGQTASSLLAGNLVSDALIAGNSVVVDPAETSYQVSIAHPVYNTANEGKEFINLDLDVNDGFQLGFNDEGDMNITRQMSPKIIPQQQELRQQVSSDIDQNTEINFEAAQETSQPNISRVKLDVRAELSNRQLAEWSTNYLANMTASQEERTARRSLAQAKRNAVFWMLDQGIGGVQVNFGEDLMPHPFAVFSGQNLLDSLTGRGTILGTKRSLSPGSRESQEEDVNEDGRRVRYRSEERQTGRGENMPPNIDQDGLPPLYDDYPVSCSTL